MQMGIEQNGTGRKGNKDKRRQKKPSRVQRLYETCKEVFAGCSPGIVPSPENVEKLTAVLDEMTQADVGLSPNMLFFEDDRAPIITYLHLHECDRFSIGIFCLPPTSVIPLHNHPGMTVFSKLLFGTMHYKSYDWLNDKLDMDIDAATVNALQSHANGLRLAKLKVDSEFTAPCETSILYPAHGGNMHILTAKTACAILDVLGPPYCDPDGRHCQYYYEFPLNNFPVESCCRFVPEEEQDEYAWLVEREEPEDLYVVGVSYNGPKIARK